MAIKFKSDIDSSQNTDNLGVSNNGPLLDDGSKKKFSFVSVLLVLSIIITVVMAIYALAPVAALFVALCLALLLVFYVVIPTILTFGLVWTIESYRAEVNSIYEMLGAMGEDGIVQKAFDFLCNTYWVVFIIGGSIVLVALFWSIIDYKLDNSTNPIKKKRMNKIIVTTVMFIIASVIAAIFLVFA